MNSIVDRSKGTNSYTQLFRNGIIESACIPYKNEKPFLNLKYMNSVISFIKNIFPVLETIGISPPLAFMLSLLNTKDFRLTCFAYGNEDVIDSYLPYKNNEFILPEIIIESKEDVLEEKLHPIFNIVRNALGLEPSDIEK